MLITATIDKLSELMDYLIGELQTFGFDHKIKKQIELAVEEALVNVISYAYPEGKVGQVELICKPLTNKGIFIFIRDWGVPFNPIEHKDPNLKAPLKDRPIGGLGIFFIRSVMDEIKYKRDNDTNILEMKKFIY